MPYLYLVRHAQPDFAGHYDSVTQLGLQQAAWLGEHFAARGLRFARTISGSLVRQSGTLETMLRHLPSAPAPTVDPASMSTTQPACSAHFIAATRSHFAPPGIVAATSLQSATRCTPGRATTALARGWESWQDFGRRVTAAADAACAGLEPSAAVLVVTSGGVIGRLVADALAAGPDAAIQLNLQTRNTGVTEMVRGRSAQRVVAFNAVPHLERADREHAVTHS
jgi:broad specificity phosphatase PhoE